MSDDPADSMEDAADRPHDPHADAVAQLADAQVQVQRSILLLQPVRPIWQKHYDELRQVRDRLEEAFTHEQMERLRAGKFDFGGDVDKLKGVIDDLAKATERMERVQEILTYVATVVEIATQIVAKLVTYL